MTALEHLSYRAPSTVLLAKIEAFMVENIELGFERTNSDTWLQLALVRYAMSHGAVTVGDLTKAEDDTP
jgi:hypothetical protein